MKKIISYRIKYSNQLPETMRVKMTPTRSEGPAFKLPYKCEMMQCRKSHLRPNSHTLQCLVVEIVNISPSKKIHVQQICHQLSKINKFYNCLFLCDFAEKVKEVAQVDNPFIRLENDICYLKSFYDPDSVVDMRLGEEIADVPDSVISITSTPELVIDLDESSSEASTTTNHTSVSVVDENSLSEDSNFNEIPSNDQEPVQSSLNIDISHLSTLIINCFLEERKVRLTTSDIASSKILKSSGNYTPGMILEALYSNKKAFQLEVDNELTGKVTYWYLKKGYASLKRTREAMIKDRATNNVMTWKEMIVRILGHEKLTRSEIEDRALDRFSFSSVVWKSNIYNNLNRNSSFKRDGEMWYLCLSEEYDRRRLKLRRGS